MLDTGGGSSYPSAAPLDNIYLACLTRPPHPPTPKGGLRYAPEAVSHCVNLSDIKNVNQSCMHSLIVPVWIHHGKDTSNKLLTYTLLNEKVDACFVKDLLRRLDINRTQSRTEDVNSPGRKGDSKSKDQRPSCM